MAKKTNNKQMWMVEFFGSNGKTFRPTFCNKEMATDFYYEIGSTYEAYLYECEIIPEGVFALCEARHEMPKEVEGAIFGNTLNPLATAEMEETAIDKVKWYNHITLYVTGLSVALVAVINACKKANTALTLMHYDRNTNTYYPQEVI